MASRLRRFGLLGGSARYLHLGDKSKNDQHELQSNASRHTIASENPLYQSSDDVALLGKPSRKKMFYTTDIAMAFIALACLAMSILVVSNGYISWYLGVGNRQLIVIGFLLSIMSLCLASVTPTSFLLLEAHVGSSTLQNYDGILRNKPLAPQLSFAWRMVLVTMLALPVGLSVAYKTFTGGESSMNVHATDYISNTTWYGLFTPPGITSVTGLSSAMNATTLFRNATQAIQHPGNSTEPDLPTFHNPQPYGYNILLLNETRAAALDTLHSDYILEIQKLLAPGETWTITAPVLGTVATLNTSAAKDRLSFEKEFISACNEGEKTKKIWSHKKEDMFNDFSISLTDRLDKSDQSSQYIGIAPGVASCEDRAPYEHLYNIYRHQCRGQWSIGRGSFQLLSGSCNDTILPWAEQQIIQWQYMALPAW
ncbi:hypothetical protein CGCSCA5_v004388 [Colletotrichum siamense]|nr:hypothetical protein CGCSCA5_v004388 [Colletotrichum siamense]